MNNQTRKLLFDVSESARSILGWCQNRSFAEYQADRQFRRAVEREFEIISEALNRLLRTDPVAAARIDHLSKIIRFRHRIIHGYDTADDATVWGVIDRHLPQLLDRVESLLQEPENRTDGSA
ncbi:MAG TPA: HepT-like ribonuclease domain-containing protein [Sedimentisphaerales bacterium]|nr:HepT-like ribonuclease domain-containing protein [Sedimentisphaerales bacterium]